MQPIARRDLLKMGGAVGLGAAAATGLAACSSGNSAASGGSGQGGAARFSAQIPIVEASALLNESAFDIAQKKGYFAARGLDLGVVNSTTGAEIIRETLSTSHFGILGSTDPMVAYAQGQTRIRIIAGLYGKAGVTYLVKKNSPIQTVADLKGKTVGASSPTSLGAYFANAALKAAGLTPGEDVQIKYVGAVTASMQAMEDGVIDCSFSGAPQSTQAVASGQARILFTAAQYAKNWFDAVVIADADYISANPAVTRNFLAALGQASAFIRSDPNDAGALWAAYSGTPVSYTQQAMTEARDAFTLSFKKSYVQAAAQAVVAEGLVKSVPEVAGIIDGSYLPSGYTYTS